MIIIGLINSRGNRKEKVNYREKKGTYWPGVGCKAISACFSLSTKGPLKYFSVLSKENSDTQGHINQINIKSIILYITLITILNVISTYYISQHTHILHII